MSGQQLVLPRPGICSCPFCGSNDVKIWPIGSQGGVTGYSVRCGDCYARGPEISIYSDDEKTAMQAWNRRHQCQPI